MKGLIKNYTIDAPVEITKAEMHQLIALGVAQEITLENDERDTLFKINVNKKEFLCRLPVKPALLHEIWETLIRSLEKPEKHETD